MDAHAFQELVVGKFPSLQEDFEEWRDLIHLQVRELLSFTQSAIEAGALNVVPQCFEIATLALTEGEESLRNAIYVSYLEHMDFRSDEGKRAEQLLPAELKLARNDILDYDERLLGRKWPTDEREPK
jgi:hypothetical protein